ncbi:MAG: DUF4235 domain-containing protein [Pseudonocardiaceae bacterium]
MSSFNKVTYEAISLTSGILGGALAGAVFTWIWREVSDAEEAPEPTALDRDMREILIAGALQGFVFGLVKAVLGRVTARGYLRLTGHELKR